MLYHEIISAEGQERRERGPAASAGGAEIGKEQMQHLAITGKSGNSKENLH